MSENQDHVTGDECGGQFLYCRGPVGPYEFPLKKLLEFSIHTTGLL